MRKLFLAFFALICFAFSTNTLKANAVSILKDTLTEDQKDSIHEAALEATMSYPYIKSSKESGVLPVPDIEEKQAANLQYKLLFLISFSDKNKMKKPNDGLSEVARSLNLHVAAGIPTTNIHAVVIVFRQGLNALLKDEKYMEKYKSSNPNIGLIEELQKAGVKFISCGQSMQRLGIKKEDMVANVKVSLAARTAMSYYAMLGYANQ